MRSELRLIKNSMEFRQKDDYGIIPGGTRGIYVLYKRRGFKNDEAHHYDVVYVGMASTSIRSRVRNHRMYKGELWTHFSAFEVWNNISDAEIAELEGLFRHLYRYDSRANKLNKQKGYKALGLVRRRSEVEWL